MYALVLRRRNGWNSIANKVDALQNVTSNSSTSQYGTFAYLNVTQREIIQNTPINFALTGQLVPPSHEALQSISNSGTYLSNIINVPVCLSNQTANRILTYVGGNGGNINCGAISGDAYAQLYGTAITTYVNTTNQYYARIMGHRTDVYLAGSVSSNQVFGTLEDPLIFVDGLTLSANFTYGSVEHAFNWDTASTLNVNIGTMYGRYEVDLAPPTNVTIGTYYYHWWGAPRIGTARTANVFNIPDATSDPTQNCETAWIPSGTGATCSRFVWGNTRIGFAHIKPGGLILSLKRWSGGGFGTGIDFVLGTTGVATITGDTSGNLKLGYAGASLSATVGHVLLPGGAGAPTGVPTGSNATNVAIFTDTTNNKLYFYSSSAWRTPVASVTGTANQITASTTAGAVTLSIPTNPVLPGYVTTDHYVTTAGTPTCTVLGPAGTGATCTVKGTDSGFVALLNTGTGVTSGATSLRINYARAFATRPYGISSSVASGTSNSELLTTSPCWTVGPGDVNGFWMFNSCLLADSKTYERTFTVMG